MNAPLSPQRNAAGLALAGALIASIAGSTALAAQAPDTIRATADSFDIVQLDSLLVSVLRTPIELGDAPFSISVVGEEELFGAKGLVSVEEMLEVVPGLQVQDRYNDAVGERFAIRGFGSRAQFGVRGIKVFVDDVPATLADGQSTLDHLELGSLGRVEVLRGPGSMLYGGAAGGVMRFSTQQPAPELFREQARVVWGSQGYRRFTSSSSGRSGATGYVVGLSVTDRDGYRLNPRESDGSSYGDSHKLQLNSRVTTPLAGGELALTANVLRMEAENPGSIGDSVLALGTREAHGFNVFRGTRKDVTQAQIGSRWSGQVGSGELEIAAYGVRRQLDNPIPNTVIDLDRNAGGVRGLYRQTHDVGSDDGTLTWAVGTDLDLQSDSRKNFGNDGGQPTDLTLDQQESVRGLGTFANLIFRPNDRVTASGGVRYDRVRFSVDDRLIPTGEPDDSGERTMDAFSPSAGVHVSVSDQVGLFANVSTSFITPTTTELANQPQSPGGFNPDLDPVTSVTVEGGLRGQIGPSAAFEVVAFRTTLDGELIPFEVATDPGRTFFRNSGQSSYDGIELTGMARPTDHLLARASYSYVDARFDDYRLADDDFSGNSVPGTAPHRFESLLRVYGDPGHVEVHTRTVSDVPVDDGGRFEAPGYTVFDLRAGLRPIGRSASGLQFAPFVSLRNVFDETYVTSVVVNAFGSRYFEPAPSRNLQIGATATWARR